MATKSFYPNLSSLVTVDQFPEQLQFVEDGLQALLDKLFYKSLQYAKTPDGSVGYFNLVLVAKDDLKVELFDSGLAVVINPGNTGEMVIPLRLTYNWPILGLIKDFNSETFSYLPDASQDILNQSITFGDTELIEIAINTFEGSLNHEAYKAFVDKVNIKYTLTGINEIPYPVPGDTFNMTEDVRWAIFSNPQIPDDIAEVVNGVYVVSLDDGIYESNLDRFSRNISGKSLKDYIKQIIIPQITASLDLSIGLAFPRNILIPLDGVGGEPLSEPEQSILEFDAGTLTFSTQGGIGFEKEMSASLKYPSQIGKTGLGIDIRKVKLDLSRTTNIVEADLDGRGSDFVGVYIQKVGITLPEKWFKRQAGSTIEIFGRNVLIGTGGFSGTIGLDVVGANDTLWVNLGSASGYRIGFKEFFIQFKQNTILQSRIHGVATIPIFKDATGQPADIQIKANIQNSGDFNITASEDQGFKEIKFKDIFSFTLKTVFFGREDDNFYIGLSGTFKFMEPTIANFLGGEFEIEKLKIWSDGRFEIEGGTLPLPEGTSIKLGPAEIAINSIGFGSHQQEHNGVMRRYNFVEFSGGINVNPGGVDVRGDGIKFFYTIDDDPQQGLNKHRFLKIQSLAIDLIIPGNASKESATALIQGYLSVRDVGNSTEYAGSVKIQLPKVKISGGAEMRYNPDYPAWAVDAHLDFAKPIPLAQSGMGIYGFRGLLAHRYTPNKSKVQGLSDESTWFEYYKAPPLGVNLSKLNTPEESEEERSPFAVGAGVTLATTPDDGWAFSSKLFLLIALPELILLDGKANIISKRIGLDGDDPPFFAFIAFAPRDSIEFGLGADYKLPKNNGWILKVYAEVQAKFYFNNSRAWYVNFGTEEKPISARLLTLFNAYAFLMLSSSGIKAGAGVDWGFNKSYAGGMVRASVQVYIKVGGEISFERPQIGAYAKVGGHVDAYLLFIGFYIGIDTSLSVEAAKPFKIHGSVRLCVGVTIGFWKFKVTIKKCFTVKFTWEKNNQVDTTPIIPLAMGGGTVPVGGLNILTGETFPVGYFGNNQPNASSSIFNNSVIPLDTYIDFQFSKGLNPNPVVDQIGGVSNPPAGNVDLIPPNSVGRQVKHEYSIEEIEVKAWNGSQWQSYNPYEAMSTPAALQIFNANPSDYKLGFWQKTGNTYNVMRLLAQSPLNYMTEGQPGWYTPEEFGVTAATLFCEGEMPVEKCVDWTEIPLSRVFRRGRWYQNGGIIFQFPDGKGEIGGPANHFNLQPSLCFPNEDSLELLVVEPSANVRLKLSTSSESVTLSYYTRKVDGNGITDYELLGSETKTRFQLIAPVQYTSVDRPISKIVINPYYPAPLQLTTLQHEIISLNSRLVENPNLPQSEQAEVRQSIQEREAELVVLNNRGCNSNGHGWDLGDLNEQLDELEDQLEDCKRDLETKKDAMERICLAYNEFKIRFETCFTEPPLGIGYEIYDEKDDDQILEYRWRLRDQLTGKILLSSSTRYVSEEAAIEEMEIALCHGVEDKGFQKKLTKDNRHYFNIVDPTGEIVGRRIEYFTTESKREQAIEFLQSTLVRFYDGNRVSMPSFEESTPDCPVDVEHLACWKEMTRTQNWNLPDYAGPIPTPGNRCAPLLGWMNDLIDDFCQEYNRLYTLLYNCNYARLEELRRNCEEANDLYLECMAECLKLEELIEEIRNLIEWLKANPNSGSSGDPCTTYLHEICYLTIEDYNLSLNLPPQQAIEEDYAAAVSSIEKMLAPIWRPDTKYYVRVKLADKVNNDVKTERDFYFGFRTAGPLGYFHEDTHANYLDTPNDDLGKYALANLRAYIDYDKSYPNADGNLINAKPLFYKVAKILLYFNKRYAYHFFGDWPAYNGLPQLDGKMEIVIKDPVEGTSIPNPPPPNVITTEIPQAVTTWPLDQSVDIPEDLQVLMNMSQLDSCLLQGGLMITPASVHTEIIPQYLKPLKLYNTIVNNVYEGDKREVHKFVFQTSRYGDFEEQVMSYKLRDDEGNQQDAVFTETVDLDNTAINLGYDIINDAQSAGSTALAGEFPERFERLLRGAWKLPHYPGSTSTEFNVLKQESSGRTFAILIRNPEPFNDPKIPDAELNRTLKVLNNGNPDPAYKILHSKDRSQIVIMNTSRNITAPQLRFRFKYLEWDGQDYADRSTINVGPLVIN